MTQLETKKKLKQATPSLLEKIHFVAASVDEGLRIILNEEWSSEKPDNRLFIRRFLENNFSINFSREQLALLNDLNWLPEAEHGYFSISHSKFMGGVSYSQYKHGFDVEEIRRISIDVLKRTCTPQEFEQSLRPEFLWVAKEAGLKALSGDYGYLRSSMPLLVSDLTCVEWTSHFENRVFGFRLKSDRTLDLELNKGFIFYEAEQLFCIYFK
jgi:hypothetical protein